MHSPAPELVRFEGTIGRRGDVGPSALTRVSFEVVRGSEAHVFALSRDWLHEVPREKLTGGAP